jgi:hypothetical protein
MPADFTAEKATKEALLKIHSPYILHLATHGFLFQSSGERASRRRDRHVRLSTNRRCDRFRYVDAYWVLSQLPLCRPLMERWAPWSRCECKGGVGERWGIVN